MRGEKGFKIAKKYGLEKTARAILAGKYYKEIFETALDEASFDKIVKIIEEANQPSWAVHFASESEHIIEGILGILHGLGPEVLASRIDDNVHMRMEFYLERLKKVALSTDSPVWACAWALFTKRDLDECIDVCCRAGDGLHIYNLALYLKEFMTEARLTKLYKALLASKKNRSAAVCYFAANVKYLSLPDLKELRKVVFDDGERIWEEWFEKYVKMGSDIKWEVVKPQ